MSMRAVDLQMLLFRLHDVQQFQTTTQQQPQVSQAQFAQIFVSRAEQQKEQVQVDYRAEGTKIREEDKGGTGRQRQRQRQKAKNQPPEKPKPTLPTDPNCRIDVRV